MGRSRWRRAEPPDVGCYWCSGCVTSSGDWQGARERVMCPRSSCGEGAGLGCPAFSFLRNEVGVLRQTRDKWIKLILTQRRKGAETQWFFLDCRFPKSANMETPALRASIHFLCGFAPLRLCVVTRHRFSLWLPVRGSSLFSVEWETSIAAASGPSGANESSRWEGSTAGRDAPTGKLVKGIPRPGGAHAEGSHRQSMRPAGAHTHTVHQSGGCAWFHQASHRLPSCAPPARSRRHLHSTENSEDPSSCVSRTATLTGR